VVLRHEGPVRSIGVGGAAGEDEDFGEFGAACSHSAVPPYSAKNSARVYSCPLLLSRLRSAADSAWPLVLACRAAANFTLTAIGRPLRLPMS